MCASGEPLGAAATGRLGWESRALRVPPINRALFGISTSADKCCSLQRLPRLTTVSHDRARKACNARKAAIGPQRSAEAITLLQHSKFNFNLVRSGLHRSRRRLRILVFLLAIDHICTRTKIVPQCTEQAGTGLTTTTSELHVGQAIPQMQEDCSRSTPPTPSSGLCWAYPAHIFLWRLTTHICTAVLTRPTSAPGLG